MKSLGARPAVLLVTVLLSLSTHPAGAQDAPALKRAHTLNRVAMEDYDLGDHASARKGLDQALVVLREGGFERHPLAAQTHLHLGIVLGAGLKTPEPAVAAFKAALAIDPTLELPPAHRAPGIMQLYDQARAAVAPPKKRDEGRVVGIAHTPVDAAAEGQAIAIEARVGDDVKAKRVLLYFRAQGAKSFVAVPMKAGEDGRYLAQIPADATATDAIEYYIEARNAKNKIAASRGNAGTPLVISIARARPAERAAEDDKALDDENPLENLPNEKKRTKR